MSKMRVKGKDLWICETDANNFSASLVESGECIFNPEISKVCNYLQSLHIVKMISFYSSLNNSKYSSLIIDILRDFKALISFKN